MTALPHQTSGHDLAMTPAVAASAATIGDYFQLMKPRVMSLVIFTGFAGLYLAPGDIHLGLAIISLLAIAAGAGASGAINQWYDRDIDLIMSRTRNRPIPAGKVEPAEALAFGVVVSVLSVLVLALAANLLAGGLLAFTIFFYAVIYTVWLKRSTPQNIVIGGAAGALPPVVGWASVTGTVSVESLALFALIFMWTPPHFWALALVKNEDYKQANVPMLPVVAGRPETLRQIVIYSVLLAPLGVAPYILGMASLVYGVVAGGLGALFVLLAVRLYRSTDDRQAWSLFKFSLIYLTVLFAGLILDKLFVQQLGLVAGLGL
ncbi:protoheme IX farnesyltransferase [SAR116 cluster alpha proteobacterium HIMB100]|nr:protoheme IX farnesyltransferase [SAR116 cluster alpha proteobacterium HIMB100]